MSLNALAECLARVFDYDAFVSMGYWSNDPKNLPRYKWEFVMPFENNTKPEKPPEIISYRDAIENKGAKLVMYLRTTEKTEMNPNNRYSPWLEIRMSDFTEAGLGLFAARDFFKGNTITVFSGRPILGPEIEEFAATDYTDEYSAQIQDVDSNFWILQPPVLPKDGFPDCDLLMGAHYINQVYLTGNKTKQRFTDREGKHALFKNNCFMDHDGKIVCSASRIFRGEELFMPYGKVDSMPTKNSAKKSDGDCIRFWPPTGTWQSVNQTIQSEPKKLPPLGPRNQHQPPPSQISIPHHESDQNLSMSSSSQVRRLVEELEIEADSSTLETFSQAYASIPNVEEIEMDSNTTEPSQELT